MTVRPNTRGVASLLMVALCTSCVHGSSGAKPQTPAPPPANTRTATHVFVGPCVFARDPEKPIKGSGESAGALLGAILPSLISQGFNLLGNTLDAAGNEQSWQAAGLANIEADAPRNGECLQVVRGTFTLKADDAKYDWATNGHFSAVAGKLKTARIYLSGEPAFFFEGRFRAASQPGVFAVAPVVAAFKEPIGTRALRGETSRGITLAFAFHAPGKSATDATNPSTSLIVGELAPGAWLEFDQTCWAAPTAPAQPSGEPGAASAPAATVTMRCVDESHWFRLPTGEKASPQSVTAVLTEVQGRSAFLTFLSDVFKGSKEDLERKEML